MKTKRHLIRTAGAFALVCATTLGLAACSGAGTGGGSAEAKELNVLMVGNPQMEDIAKLTPDSFTKDTGIKINFTILPETEMRDRVTRDVATGAGQYDVVMVSSYETGIWAKNGWLTSLDDYSTKDAAYDKADLLQPVLETLKGEDGKLYSVPFYGETSLMMYRKDLFEKAGLTMPEHPTWTQVQEFAQKLDNKQTGTAGICLRGIQGWGENFAVYSTVLNTFGGTYFDMDWNPQLTSPESKKAANFYVDTVRKYGEAGAPQAGYSECLNQFGQGKAAMWYDASAAANVVKNPEISKVAANVGYAFAPVEKTKSSGWLSAWSWAMPKSTKKADTAWQFMSWASGKDYEKLAGEKLGWNRVPDGKRTSTYAIPEFQKASDGNYQIVLDSIKQADPKNPGTQERPYVGVNYVSIPEWQDLGTKMSQQFSAAIAGTTTVDEALEQSQQLAIEVAKNYKK